MASECTAEFDYDVAIVGGGIVGMALAAALQHTSLRLALLEQREISPNDSSDQDYDERSLALSYVSVKILQQIGVWEALSPHAAPMRHVHISEKGRFGITRLHADEYNVDALGYVVTIRELGETLSRQLVDHENLTWISPATCQTCTPDADGVTLEIKAKQGEQSLRARLLIVADGAHSQLREAMGIETRVTDYEQQALVANLSVEGAPADWAYERFTAEGPMAFLPLYNNRYALVWTGTPQKTADRMSWSDDVFLQALQQQIGERVGRLHYSGKREAFPLRQVLANRMTGPRTALIGNAAHTLHPVAGQGLNLALRDVQALVMLLSESKDPGATALLEQFAALRMDDVAGTSGTTDALIRIFDVNNFLISHARSMGLGVLDCTPVLKRRVGRYGMGFRTALTAAFEPAAS